MRFIEIAVIDLNRAGPKQALQIVRLERERLLVSLQGPLRIGKACDMLAKGKRRVCCFDRSGMYSKSMSCPVADDEANDTRS